MKKYDLLILNELLDKYEHSKLSKEGSRRNLNISIKSNNPILKDYWSEESYLHKDQINMILDDLQKKKFIFIRHDKNKELDFIDLNVDSVSKIYVFLKRISPEEKRSELLEFMSSFRSKNQVVESFIKNMIARLRSYKSIQAYIDDLDSLKLYIKAIEEMAQLEEDTLKRNFSKKVFNDSKLFERIENKVLKIVREFSDYDIEDNDELLSLFHIVKTPTFVYLKGGLIINVKNQMIDLSVYGHELALSSSALADLEIIEVAVKKVITIENLTTFVSFNNPDYVAIYLGGFHNSVKRELLNKISKYDANIEFYHFGDIDAGGLYIFEDLVAKTGIQFTPYLMDIMTLERYKLFWMKLTQNDKKRLEKLNDGRFSQLVQFMVKNNCKLEQEAIQ